MISKERGRLNMKTKLNKKEFDIVWGVLQHFLDDDMGGYPITTSADVEKVIKKKMSYLKLNDNKRYELVGEVDKEHQLQYYKHEHDYFKERLYDTLNTLTKLGDGIDF